MFLIYNYLKIFQFQKNYPNPFNPNTTIEYYLGESGMVKINAYDLNGKLVDSIIDSLSSFWQTFSNLAAN